MRRLVKLLAAFLLAATPALAQINGGAEGTYPQGAVPITASATGTTGATAATLAASALQHTWICGFSIFSAATGAATGTATITGAGSATMSYAQFTSPIASGVAKTGDNYAPCIMSSAINTGIAVNATAPGSGGLITVVAWGFQL